MKRRILATLLSVFIVLSQPWTLLAASGCTYPSTLDSFTDKVAGDSLTVANVNTISCAIEKQQIETGVLAKGSFGSIAARLTSIDARFVTLLGVAGGQTVIGGTASGNNLLLQSTSNPTRGVVRIEDNFALDVNTPAQITANQNDYSLSNKGVQRWSSDAARSITGLAGGANSKIVYAYNVGSFPIVVSHESSSSAAGNRVTTVDALDMTVWAGRGAVFVYDSTTSRWRGSLLGSPEYTVVKIADEIINTVTTFQNDDHLLVPVTASRQYEFSTCLVLNAVNGTGDAKFQFTVPAGTTMRWGSSVDVPSGGGVTGMWNPGGPSTTPSALLSESGIYIVGALNGTTGVCFMGLITSSTTTGNITLQWAQNVANGSDTKLLTGSWMRIRPLI